MFNKALLLLAALPLSCMAREAKPMASVNFVYEADAQVKDPGTFATDTGEASAAVQQLDLRGSFPVWFGEKWRVLGSARASWTGFSWDHLNVDDVDAYQLSVPFRVMGEINENHGFFGIIGINYYSDLKEWDSNDLKPSAVLMATYKGWENWTLYYGAAYTRDFGSDKAFPVAGFEWESAERWTLSLLYPRPGVTYKVNDSLTLDAGLSVAGGAWGISDPRQGNSGERFNMEFKGWRGGIGATYKLTDTWALSAGIGSTFAREYVIENDNETLLDSDVNDTWGWRFALQLLR